MSDIYIPGVTSRIDSAKIIEGLMKLEAIPKDRAEARLEQLKLEKNSWLELNGRLVATRTSAKNLYSFNNPFFERTAESSDPKVLIAVATREAIEETRSIQVEQIATADRFLSDTLPKDYKVPAGTYRFTVGEKSVELRYGGGGLQDFVDALTRKGGDLVRARSMPITSDTRALLIEAIPTGSANRLAFGGDAERLALDTGLLERSLSKERVLSPSDPALAAWDPSLGKGGVTALEGILKAAPSSSARLAVSPAIPAKGMTLEYEVRVTRGSAAAAPAGPPPGPSLPDSGSITWGGITIRSAPSEAAVPDWTPPPAPPVVDDPNSLYLLDTSGRESALSAPLDDGAWHKVSIPLDAILSGDIAAFAVRNRDTSRTVEVRGVRLFDPTETGGFRPRNARDTAGDAVVVMDGVEMTRSTNSIDDIIPGVTLTLKSASDDEVELAIEPDRDAVKEAIIELVGNYNRLMVEINVLQRNDEKLISEVTYLSDDEVEAYKKQLGTLSADSSLSSLRSSLQRAMMNPYPVGDGRMALLASLGISTNASRGGGYDASKMRGYLEIDEKALDKALEANFEAARRLFGYDTDGDLIVDAGVGHMLDALLGPYVDTGGIVQLKTGTIDAKAKDQTAMIDTLVRQLAAKESELRREYGALEGALDRMESLSTSIENFGNSASGE
ncbi:MAG: flagellar filament capping protein FliD [Spirochaetales bacterium]|nr:flagellar filament capping protein FliD [Spirochaetales bacterium]